LIKCEEKKENKTEEEVPTADLSQLLLLNDPAAAEPAKLRIIGLYGEVTEDSAAETTYSLLALRELGKIEELIDPEDPESEYLTTYQPMEFIISTWGGSAADMFSIYDIMRTVRKDCEINTLGLGKVMSAGVLLLAAGTKGQRKIGKNCRVMLHGVTSGQHGNISDLENEMAEAKWTQERLVVCLSEETKMTKKQVKKILEKRMNVYFTAEEAVELGMADEIV
jgi:ATP-dependent Clp endopeptidase proteolytic subunit ClpP